MADVKKIPVDTEKLETERVMEWLKGSAPIFDDSETIPPMKECQIASNNRKKSKELLIPITVTSIMHEMGIQEKLDNQRSK
jgi:hypothetical protein